jgi:hypothetical protein
MSAVPIATITSRRWLKVSQVCHVALPLHSSPQSGHALQELPLPVALTIPPETMTTNVIKALMVIN